MNMPRSLLRNVLRFAAGFLLASIGTWGWGDVEAKPWFHQAEATVEDWRLIESRWTPWVRELEPRQSSGDDGHRILVFFPKSSSAYNTAMAEMLRVFRSRKRWPVWTLVHYKKAPGLLKRYLRRAEKGQFDLIFAMGSQAAQDLHANYRTGKVPVVTVCAKDPVILGLVDDYEGAPEGNIAYTSLNVPIAGQLSYLSQLRPDLKRVAVVYSERNSSAVQTQVEPLKAISQEVGLEILDIAVKSPRFARRELDKKIKKAALTMASDDAEKEQSVFWVTGSSAVFAHMDVVLQRAGGFPVLAVTPSLVHGGANSALLSVGVSFESNAELASVYAIKILAGQARAGDLPVGVVVPPDIAIHMGKAKELGLAIPFRLFEAAGVIYDFEGNLVRVKGRAVPSADKGN